MADRLYPITVPKWGIEMQEGTITGWQVAVGTTVAKGDELIDIETDKIVNTMEAPVDGVVCRQLVEEGETLKVGELLGVIAMSDASDSEIDAFILAIELETLDDLHSKQVAFVTGNQDGCRFLVDCARSRGFSWSVFQNLSDAAAWLHRPEACIPAGHAPAN